MPGNARQIHSLPCYQLPFYCVWALVKGLILTALGAVKGIAVLAPVTVLTIPAWVFGAVWHWPQDVAITYYTVAVTQRLGWNLRILALLLLPFPLLAWPLAVGIGSLLFSIGVGFFWPLGATVSIGSLSATKELLSVAVWDPIHLAKTSAVDVWRFNAEGYFSYLDEMRWPYYGEPLDVSPLRLLMAVALALLCSLLSAFSVLILGSLRLPFVMGRMLAEWVQLLTKLPVKLICLWLPIWLLGVPAMPVVVLGLFLLVLLGCLICLGPSCGVVAYVSNPSHRTFTWGMLAALDFMYSHIYALDESAVRMTGLGTSSLLPAPARHSSHTFISAQAQAAAAEPMATGPAVPATPTPQNQAWSTFEDMCGACVQRGVMWGWVRRADLADSEPYLFLGLPAAALLQMLADAAAVAPNWMPDHADCPRALALAAGGAAAAVCGGGVAGAGGGEAAGADRRAGEEGAPAAAAAARVSAPGGTALGGGERELLSSGATSEARDSVHEMELAHAHAQGHGQGHGQGQGHTRSRPAGLPPLPGPAALPPGLARILQAEGGRSVPRPRKASDAGSSEPHGPSARRCSLGSDVGSVIVHEDDHGEGGSIGSAATCGMALPWHEPLPSVASDAGHGEDLGEAGTEEAFALGAGPWLPLVPAALELPAAGAVERGRTQPDVGTRDSGDTPPALEAEAAQRPISPPRPAAGQGASGGGAADAQGPEQPPQPSASVADGPAAALAGDGGGSVAAAGEDKAAAATPPAQGGAALDPAAALALLEELAEHVLGGDIGFSSAANPVRLHRSLLSLQVTAVEMCYMACHTLLPGEERVATLVPLVVAIRPPTAPGHKGHTASGSQPAPTAGAHGNAHSRRGSRGRWSLNGAGSRPASNGNVAMPAHKPEGVFRFFGREAAAATATAPAPGSEGGPGPGTAPSSPGLYGRMSVEEVPGADALPVVPAPVSVPPPRHYWRKPWSFGGSAPCDANADVEAGLRGTAQAAVQHLADGAVSDADTDGLNPVARPAAAGTMAATETARGSAVPQPEGRVARLEVVVIRPSGETAATEGEAATASPRVAGAVQVQAPAPGLPPRHGHSNSGSRWPFGRGHRRSRSQPISDLRLPAVPHAAEVTAGVHVAPSPRSLPGRSSAGGAPAAAVALAAAAGAASPRLPFRISETGSAGLEAADAAADQADATAEALVEAAASSGLLITPQRLAQLHAFTAAVQSVATALSKKKPMMEIMGRLLQKYGTCESVCSEVA